MKCKLSINLSCQLEIGKPEVEFDMMSQESGLGLSVGKVLLVHAETWS